MDGTRSARARAAHATAHAARAATSRRALPYWSAAAAAVAIGAAFIAAGGLNAAPADVEKVEGDAAVRTSLYSVRVIDAEVTDAVEDQFLEAEPGEDLLVITAIIENLSEHPIGVGTAADGVESRLINSRSPLLVVPESTGSFSTRAWRPDGSSGPVILQPGVPGEVRLAWSVPEGSFPEGILGLDVFDVEEQGGRIILSASTITWQRADQIAEITIEVER